MKRVLFVVGCIAVIAVLIYAAIVYDTWFAANCLKSHEEPYTYYVTGCASYNKNGTCRTPFIYTRQGVETICDQWKKR